MLKLIGVIMTMTFCLFSANVHAQAVGGSGKGGGGLKDAKALNYGCEEGRVQPVLFPNAEGDQELQRRTCRNGSYMTDEERAAYVYTPRTRCKEGRLETWTEHNGDATERIRFRKMVCREGKWVERP